MKIKTQDLIGPALDWAAEEALGGDHTYRPREYSTDWALGGPILDREHICPDWLVSEWSAHRAFVRTAPGGTSYISQGPYSFGPTPLIAAMRCLVASKLGEEVEIPDELL